MHIYELNGKRPRIHKTARVLDGAVVAGDVVIGPDVLVSWHAVVYAEEAPLEIGRGACIGDGALVHARGNPIRVGDYAMIGHGAQVCDASVGNRAQVGINAVAIHGAFVAEESMLAADSFLWKEAMNPRTLWAGRPAKEVDSHHEEGLEKRAHEKLAIFGTMQVVDLRSVQYE
ncbi:MAG TPA: hypothetical protein VF173_00870 [Thermoanaerobaculia bacterium]|nr:hypothetical protein [Thermoanaerobaculia bacterium]